MREQRVRGICEAKDEEGESKGEVKESLVSGNDRNGGWGFCTKVCGPFIFKICSANPNCYWRRPLCA